MVEESAVRADVPHLLLVGARREVVGKLTGLPVAVTLIQPPGQDSFFEQSVTLRTINVDLTDIPALVACAREVHQQRPLDAVLSLTEPGLLSASVAADAVGARANPASAVASTVDKAAMRRRLTEQGLDTTAYQVGEHLDEAVAFSAGCAAGIIVKPLDGSGSAGVALARRPEDVPGAWEWCAAAVNGRQVLAEEYLPGREFSAETVTVAGRHQLLAITEKHTTGPPHFVETGHDMPARLSDREAAALSATAFRALDAVGHAWGPCHTELVMNAGRVSIIEINTRVGGDRIWEMVELATGIDLVAASVRALAFGALPPAAPGPPGGASVRFLTPPAGLVRAVHGADRARSVPGVLRVGELPAVGQVIEPLATSDQRAGFVLAVGADVESAARAADEAAGRIVISTAYPADDTLLEQVPLMRQL